MIHASWAPAVEQRADGMGEGLPGGVVDVDLEQHHRLTTEDRLVRRADHHLRGVGLAVDVAGAGAEAAALDGHRWERTEARGQRGDQRRTRGRRELHAEVETAGGRADGGQQLHDGGRGVGQQPVGRPHHARPGGDRPTRRGCRSPAPRGQRTCRRRRRWRRAHRPRGSAPAREAAGAGGPRRRPAPRTRTGRACRTRSGRRASSTSAAMCDAVRTTVVSSVWTWALVAAIPQRSTGSTSRPQPRTGRRSTIERTSSTSAPASRSEPSAMSPAMPEKQWNQATRLTSASAARHRRRRSRCRCRPR